MPTTIALALGGGGSRGDFQVGAVTYVYEYMNQVHNILQPHILCGTSSGSILAAKLCEGEDPNEQSRGLPGLIHFWELLTGSQDMWNEEDWFHELSAAAKLDWLDWVGIGFYDSPDQWGFRVFWRVFWSDVQQAATAKSLYNIQPVRDKLEHGGAQPRLGARSP